MHIWMGTVFIQVLLWEVTPSCSRDLGLLHLSVVFFTLYSHFFCPLFPYLPGVSLFWESEGNAKVSEQPFFLPFPKGACPFLLSALLLHYNSFTMALLSLSDKSTEDYNSSNTLVSLIFTFCLGFGG